MQVFTQHLQGRPAVSLTRPDIQRTPYQLKLAEKSTKLPTSKSSNQNAQPQTSPSPSLSPSSRRAGGVAHPSRHSHSQVSKPPASKFNHTKLPLAVQSGVPPPLALPSSEQVAPLAASPEQSYLSFSQKPRGFKITISTEVPPSTPALTPTPTPTPTPSLTPTSTPTLTSASVYAKSFPQHVSEPTHPASESLNMSAHQSKREELRRRAHSAREQIALKLSHLQGEMSSMQSHLRSLSTRSDSVVVLAPPTANALRVSIPALPKLQGIHVVREETHEGAAAVDYVKEAEMLAKTLSKK